jgi:hypothetical protein
LGQGNRTGLEAIGLQKTRQIGDGARHVEQLALMMLEAQLPHRGPRPPQAWKKGVADIPKHQRGMRSELGGVRADPPKTAYSRYG